MTKCLLKTLIDKMSQNRKTKDKMSIEKMLIDKLPRQNLISAYDKIPAEKCLLITYQTDQ